jgi:SAM-dependent methyltransferase
VGEKLPFADASVDGVIYMNALHHVPVEGQEKAMAEAARVLKPGGTLLIVEPLAEGPHFQLVRAIEDESEIRKKAYEALKSAPGLRQDSETFYDAPIRYDDFEGFKKRTTGVDPSRGPKVEAQRASLEAAFARLGRSQADGVWFSQPTRANVLTKSS